MVHHIRLDKATPETKKFEEFKIRLSTKQIKALKNLLDIKNDVSPRTMMTVFLTQTLK